METVLNSVRKAKAIEDMVSPVEIDNIQGLPKVWKPLNNFCKNENIKKW